MPRRLHTVVLRHHKAASLDDLYRQLERGIETCVRGLSRTIAYGYMTEDEIRSEAHTAFLRVARRWRPDGGAKLSTLLNQSVNRAVITKVQAAKKRRRWPALAPAQLSEESEHFLVDRRPSNGGCDGLIEQIEKRMTKDGYRVLCSILANGSIRKTARDVGIKREAVQGILFEEIVPIVFDGITNKEQLWVRGRRRRLLSNTGGRPAVALRR